MARGVAQLLGIMLLVGASLTSIGWSLANLPEPTVTLAYADTGRGDDVDQSPIEHSGVDDLLAHTGFDSSPELPAPAGPGRDPGVYRVGDPAAPDGDGRRGRRDRDVQPRVPPYGEAVDDLFESTIAPVEPIVVRGEIPPGLYATSFETEGCSYQLTQVMRNREVAVIGEDQLGAGRVLVHLNEIEPDWFSSSASCGPWYQWTPVPEALRRAGNGDYWVGDLARGTWTVPEGCRWEKVVGFRGAALDDVTDYGSAPAPLVVDAQTHGVRVRGCTRPMMLEG
jgi:hypothetical protein